MTEFTIQLEAKPRPWSTNQDRKINPYLRSEIKNVWKDAARLAYRKYRMQYGITGYLPGKAIITVTIPFTKKATRDPHNYCGTVLKAIVDGLVAAKLAPDDSPEYVGHREPILVVDRGAFPTVRIEVET